MKSKVKWFNDEKGFGFIEYKGQDIFVHYSAIISKKGEHKMLIKDEIVEFEIVKTKNGLRAKNVKCTTIKEEKEEK